MLILNRVLITMIKARFGIVWTLVGAAPLFSTRSLTRRHARGRTGHRAFRVVGAPGNAGPRWFENHVRRPTRCLALLIAASTTTHVEPPVEAEMGRAFRASRERQVIAVE